MNQLATTIGIVAPLLAIAVAAMTFLMKYNQEKTDARRKEFFNLIGLMEGHRSVVSTRTAIYALRYYPEHSNFSQRLLENLMKHYKPDDESVKPALQEEIDNTLENLKNLN